MSKNSGPQYIGRNGFTRNSIPRSHRRSASMVSEPIFKKTAPKGISEEAAKLLADALRGFLKS